MKRKATMVLDWYLASIAGEYLKGYWITSSARDKTPLHGMHLSAESTAALWLYFGDTNGRIPNPAPTEGHTAYRHWITTVHLAVSDYRPPEILKDIATDRDEPFVHREYMHRNPMKPRESNFVGRRYGIAAIVGEGQRIPPDMTRWKVQSIPKNPTAEPSTFFVKHPKPEEPSWQVWQGASPYETVLRHGRALVAVYDIDKADPHPFIEAPIRESAFCDFFERKEWWFFDTGSMLMAVRSVKPFQWLGKRRFGYTHFGKTAETRVLRSEGQKHAIMVQTARPDSYEKHDATARLEAFADAVLTRIEVDARDVNSATPKVAVTTLNGDKLYLTANGERRINRRALEFDNWPLLRNPWIHQALGESQLTLKHGGARRVYDFNKWEIIEGSSR
jgi:hypothetical protein